MPIPQVKMNMFKCFNEINASEVVSSKQGNNVLINNVISSKEGIQVNNATLTIKKSDREFQITNPLAIKLSGDISVNSTGISKNGEELETTIPIPKQDN